MNIQFSQLGTQPNIFGMKQSDMPQDAKEGQQPSFNMSAIHRDKDASQIFYNQYIISDLQIQNHFKENAYFNNP